MLWARRVAAIGDEAAASLTEIAGGDLARLRAVFGRALATDPATRFDTALEFAGALHEAFQSAVGSRQSPVVSPQSAVGSQQSAVGSADSAVSPAQVRSETREAPEPWLPLDAVAVDAARLLSEPAAPVEIVEATAEPVVEEIAEPVLVRGDFNLRERERAALRRRRVGSGRCLLGGAAGRRRPLSMDTYRVAPPDGALDSARTAVVDCAARVRARHRRRAGVRGRLWHRNPRPVRGAGRSIDGRCDSSGLE